MLTCMTIWAAAIVLLFPGGFISAVYFSIPYFIEKNVAIALALSQAALLVHAQMGRGFVDLNRGNVHM